MNNLVKGLVAGVVVGTVCALFGISPILGVFTAIIVGVCEGAESETDKAIREVDAEYRRAGVSSF